MPYKKKSRASRACDFCHKRAVKCVPSEEPGTCLTCFKYGHKCTNERPLRKRGPNSGPRKQESIAAAPVPPAPVSAAPIVVSEDSSDLAALHSVISKLIYIHFENVYPIFPFLDEARFVSEWNSGQWHGDNQDYACLYALCALSMKHVEDGALIVDVDRSDLVFDSHFFMNRCMEVFPSDLMQCRNRLTFLQTLGLLILYETQCGNDFHLQRYMGYYLTLMGLDGLHNEVRWPKDLDAREIQTRRRLYWSLYRLEIHSAYVMGHMVRMHGSQSTVLYPSPTLAPELDYTSTVSHNSWLEGWNFITDCYRILECCLEMFRPKLKLENSQSEDIISRLNIFKGIVQNDTFEKISTEGYDALPEVFKGASTSIDSTLTIRNGFQAANITCTMLLMKLVCLSMKPTDIVEHSLRVVEDLIEHTRAIPNNYFKAVGTPMFQELSGFGYILSRFVTYPALSEEYVNVKLALYALADLLDRLNDFNSSLKINQFREFLKKIDSEAP